MPISLTSKQTLLSLAHEITRRMDGMIVDEGEEITIALIHNVTVTLTVTTITLHRENERDLTISGAGSLPAIAQRVVDNAKIMAGVVEVEV